MQRLIESACPGAEPDAAEPDAAGARPEPPPEKPRAPLTAADLRRKYFKAVLVRPPPKAQPLALALAVLAAVLSRWVPPVDNVGTSAIRPRLLI